MSTCTAIAANSDVSGIGIRVNLYIMALITAVLPTSPAGAGAEARGSEGAALQEVVSSTAAISGVSLLITAVVQTAQGQLSLYHAIFVIHVLYFTTLVVVPGGHYKTDNDIARLIRVVLTIFLIYGSIMLFTGYALYVWVKAPTFGNSPECNDQIKYIIVFHSVPATMGWLRKFWIAALVIPFGVLFIVPLASAFLSHGRQKASNRQPSASPNRTIWNLTILLMRCIIKPVGAVYSIIMLELYVRRNRHLIADGEQQWSFGQIMALVQIFGIINEILHGLISSAPKKKTRIQNVWKKARREERQQGQQESVELDHM